MNRKVVAASRRALGDKDPNSVIRIGNLGLIQTQRGNYAEALKNVDEAYAAIQEIWQSNPHELHWAERIKALVYESAGRFAAARRRRENSGAWREIISEPESPEYARALDGSRRDLSLIQGNTDKAGVLLDKALAAEEDAGGAGRPSCSGCARDGAQRGGRVPGGRSRARRALTSPEQVSRSDPGPACSANWRGP